MVYYLDGRPDVRLPSGDLTDTAGTADLKVLGDFGDKTFADFGDKAFADFGATTFPDFWFFCFVTGLGLDWKSLSKTASVSSTLLSWSLELSEDELRLIFRFL